ncbi:MAG TPA: TonB-dependent receptor plug domain-containing protein [Terriglobales bacterium]|nr:TonB-dependent receptor plug domain-containing protein [Terriglobales bacterium]
MFRSFRTAAFILGIILLFLVPEFSAAAEPGTIKGTITDPLGAVIPNAQVELFRNGEPSATTTTDQVGTFEFSGLSSGRYHVHAQAHQFASETSSDVYLGGGTVQINLSLRVGTTTQKIVVSATGMEIPDSQVGASVSVIDESQFQNKLDVIELLRLVPGLQIIQVGQRGGQATLFLRGGNENANKVLLDGIPINDIGGGVDFTDIAGTGIAQAEVLRGPNSVLYGADALAGVINLTTRRGETPLPELVYSADGGNFSTMRQTASLAGAYRQLDYFSEFSRFDTRNSEPHSAFHNGTYAGNFGWTPVSSTQLRLTARRTVTAVEDPNALDFYGIADDSFQKEQDTFLGASLQNQTTSRWLNQVRYGATRLRSQFENPSPTGIPLDPFGLGPNYVGLPVTIHGANGFSTSGQAILDFGGTYPQRFNTLTNRDFVSAQSNYAFNSHLAAVLGFRYENERGFTNSGTRTPTDRDNFGYTLETHGNLWTRAYATVGLGVENNQVFGVAVTPRVSLAYYLFRPDSAGIFDGTKLKFNFGRGIKEPDILSESTSLFNLLSQAGNGQQLISQFHVRPIGPERSRSYDFGVEQTVWNARARFGLTFFHNQFTDQMEFLDQNALFALGLPTNFGATVNSADFRAQGIESEMEFNLGRGLRVRTNYTYLDSVVQRSFQSSALGPVTNPALPPIPIGAFSPLVGSRPFRRAPHSGSFLVTYDQPKFTVALGGYLASRRDDSTFLTDGFFGNTMLLPNRNLAGSYQKIDFSGSYRATHILSFYASVENLVSEHYDAASGFPSLPLAFRTGIRITLGGESWNIR